MGDRRAGFPGRAGQPAHHARIAFTLVEVLVATSILSIGLLGALTAFSMASRVTGASSRETVISTLAQQKLAEIRALAKADELTEGESEGYFGERYPGYRWRTRVSEPDEMRVRRVELIIYSPEMRREHETRFSTELF